MVKFDLSLNGVTVYENIKITSNNKNFIRFLWKGKEFQVSKKRFDVVVEVQVLSDLTSEQLKSFLDDDLKNS